jgi:hypothetical protein
VPGEFGYHRRFVSRGPRLCTARLNLVQTTGEVNLEQRRRVTRRAAGRLRHDAGKTQHRQIQLSIKKSTTRTRLPSRRSRSNIRATPRAGLGHGPRSNASPSLPGKIPDLLFSHSLHPLLPLAERRLGIRRSRPEAPDRGCPSPEYRRRAPSTSASAAPHRPAPDWRLLTSSCSPTCCAQPQVLSSPRFSYRRGGSVRAPQRSTLCVAQLHGEKRGDAALLCRVRIATPFALRDVRLRERADSKLLRRLRKTRWGSRCCSNSARSGAPTSHRCR